jgi:hypothetical protein
VGPSRVHRIVCHLDTLPYRAASWRMLRILAALAGVLLAAPPLDAQVGLASSAQSVVLSATKLGSVRVRLPGGSSAALPGSLGFGPNDFTPLAVETAWDLDPSVTSAVSLAAFFEVPAAAFTGPGTPIPASAVSGRTSGAAQAGFTPFTGGPVTAGEITAAVPGGTLLVFSQSVTAGTGSRTDQLQVRIDLGGWTSLAPGQYHGTLNLLAITQ